MSINWSGIGSTLGGVVTALGSVGVTGTNMQSVLAAIGLASNPNESVELAICVQLLQFSGQPLMLAALALWR